MAFTYDGNWDGDAGKKENWMLVCTTCGRTLGDHYDRVCPWVQEADSAITAESVTESTHPLQETFDAVIAQVTKGKGERHGGEATPFFDQRWYPIAKSTGVGGLMFQAIKKAEEACEKPDQETFERELLGAIAYLGMAYLFVQKHGFKGKE